MADDSIRGAVKRRPRSALHVPGERPLDRLSVWNDERREEARAIGDPRSIASIIDHTLLRPDATRLEIEAHCHEAARFGFATVCVNPVWVATCAALLAGRGVGVASVVAFPFGATSSEAKVAEAHRAIFQGASELDVVINLGALKSGDLCAVANDIEALAILCRDSGVLSKVIIETALLTDEQKVTACTLAQVSGADYVKTSTGFGPGGATVSDVALMRRVVGPFLGVKAAGGISDVTRLRAMVTAGASRIGTSSGVKIMQEAEGSQDPFIIT